MCHAHTTYGTAWCTTGRKLDMISQDAAAFYNSHAVIGASAGAVAVEKESGTSVAREIGKNRGVLHQNHGLLTCSRHSIDDAAFWFIALERACQQQLLIEATGIKPQEISQKTAEYSREHVGSDYIGWLHFQTLYGQTRRHPARHVRLSRELRERSLSRSVYHRSVTSASTLRRVTRP